MAEETRTKVYDVQVQGADALKALAELRLQSQGLKDEQKALGTVTKDNAARYFELDSQIKATNQQAAAYQKQITNSIKLQNAQNQSLEKLRTQLSLDTAELAKLGNTSENAFRKEILVNRIAETTAELKKQEEAYGDHRRSVGDYEKATRSLRTELRQYTEQIARAIAEGRNQGAEYDALVEKVGKLRDAQADATAQISAAASDTRSFDAITQGVQGVAAAYQLWQTGAALVGGENEQLEKIMQKMVVVMGALNALTTIQNLLQKQSTVYMAANNLLQKVGINQTLARTKAEAAYNAMIGKGTIAQKAVAAATWLWNAALAANPVVIIGVAVAALTAGVVALTSAFGAGAKAQRDSKKAADDYNRSLRETEAIVSSIDKELQNRTANFKLSVDTEIEAMRARGASQSEIAKRELELLKTTAAMESDAAKARIAANSATIDSINKLIMAKERELATYREGGKRYREASEALDELRVKYDDLGYSIQSDARLVEQHALDVLVAVREAGANTAQTVKDAAKAALDEYVSASNMTQKIMEESLKAANVHLGDNIRERLAFEAELFKIQQDGEKARLEARLRAKDLTVAQYTDEYRLITLASEQFYAKQSADLNKYYEDSRAKLLSAAGRDTEMQIADLVIEYQNAMKQLGDIQAPIRIAGMSDAEFKAAMDSYEEFLYNREALELRLTQKLDADIAKLRESSLQAQYTKITETIQNEYDNDFKRYSNNEAKKLEVTIESLRKRVAALKQAGLDSAEDEAALQLAISQQSTLNLERDLTDMSLRLKDRHMLTRNSLLSELELWQDNADKQSEILRKLTDNDISYFEQRAAKVFEWASVVQDGLNAVNDIFDAQDDRRLQAVKLQYDEQRQELDDLLERRLITQEAYNAKSSKLDTQQAKAEAKIQKEKAIRERVAATFSIAASTAKGIMEAVSTFWITGGLPWSAIIAALGAAQAAAVWAAPMPKAATGMLVSGKSHAAGGEIIEAEGGEAIINKRSTSMFAPLLSAINEMGGGIPFTTPGADGGYSIRSAMVGTGGATKEDIAEAVSEAVGKLRIIATIDDIERARANYVDIQSQGNLF